MSSGFTFLNSQATISHVLGAKEDMVSVQKYTLQFRLSRVESFLKLYGFSKKWKISFIISGPKPFLSL